MHRTLAAGRRAAGRRVRVARMASEGCGRSDDLGPPITVQANRTSVVRYLSDKTASQRRDTFPAVTTASTRSPRPTLLGVPYDAGSSYLRGPASAPPLIRRALESPSSNRWSELGRDLGDSRNLDDAGISLSLSATSAERLKAARVISSQPARFRSSSAATIPSPIRSSGPFRP